MTVEEIKTWVRRNPMLAYPAMGLSGLAFMSFLMMGTKTTPTTGKNNVQSSAVKEIGLSAGGIDQQALLSRIEQNYEDIEDRLKAMEQQSKNMQTTTKELKKSQKEAAKTVSALDNHLTAKIEDRLAQWQDQRGLTATQMVDLSVAQIQPIEAQDAEYVYLPMGSFCKGTLLTGVYAASDSNNPLPVLISLDEAFYGPNRTRIPLKGSFVLGRAYGDMVSERALIQIIGISSVLPDGQTFEREENLGYITDDKGELGIRGQVIRNTGTAMAASFMGGFTSGGAQALADSEVTTHRTTEGSASREVTGDATRNALFSGLAQSAAKMSEYYSQQAQNLVPAVHVKSGTPIYFIVQKGIKINGLARNHFMAVHSLD